MTVWGRALYKVPQREQGGCGQVLASFIGIFIRDAA